jgi:hypothetical protein
MFSDMRRSIVTACIALALCAPAAAQSYNDPLAFGMTPQQVEQTVNAPLIYLSGHRGSERYMIQRMSTVPGFYPVDARIILQFRRGRLTGWRRDWQMRLYWF